MDSWELVFRNGFAPGYTDAHLKCILGALEADDARLIQGSTSRPAPMMCVENWYAEAGCVNSYPGAVDAGGFAPKSVRQEPGEKPRYVTVGMLEEFFARACFQADQRLGEVAACRWFLNKWDDTPRAEMFALMIRVVRDILRERGVEVPASRAGSQLTA